MSKHKVSMFDWLSAPKPSVVKRNMKRRHIRKFTGRKALPERVTVYCEMYTMHTNHGVLMKDLYATATQTLGIGIGSIREGYECWLLFEREKGDKGARDV